MELEISIVEKVKNLLKIQDDLNLIELYQKLFAFRNACHPDRYLDESAKKEAEERFKDTSTYLDELARLIERESFKKAPGELAVYQKDVEIVRDKQEILKCQDNIERLEEEKRYLKEQIKDLKGEVDSSRNKELEKKTEELISVYKPIKKRNLITFGVSFVLLSILGVMNRVEDMGILIARYSPLSAGVMNSLIFLALTITTLVYILFLIKVLYEENYLRNSSKLVCTPSCIADFRNFLTNNGNKDSFYEFDAHKYLSDKLKSQHKAPIDYLIKKLLNIYDDTTTDSLKDIFIYNLLNKRLIEISGVSNLDRRFLIRNSNYYDGYWHYM